MAVIPPGSTPGTATSLDSATGSIAITPSDTTDLPYAVREVIIGTAAGTIRWRNAWGQEWDTGPLPVGSYPIAAHRILAAGTTATGLTGLL